MAHRRTQPFQRLDEGAGLEVPRRQLGHDQAGLGEVVHGGALDEVEPLPRSGGVTARERGVGGAGQGDDGGEPLGEGVVDLAGDPLTLVLHPAIALHRRQRGLRVSWSAA